MGDNVCAFCGGDKRQNPEKHFSELAGFMMKQIEECQKIINNLWEPEKTAEIGAVESDSTKTEVSL